MNGIELWVRRGHDGIEQIILPHEKFLSSMHAGNLHVLGWNKHPEKFSHILEQLAKSELQRYLKGKKK